MNSHVSDILVVGGGAAGLSAALAASSKNGVNVTILDDNPRLGGQIWRAELGKTKSSEARKLIDAVEAGGIKIVNDATVFGQSGERSLLAESHAGPIEFEFGKLIIATGARERFLPFPGWTLPNVFGAGGLQALVKGGLNIENKRLVVAGTGALLLAVAAYLGSKGARVLAIAEQTSASKLNRFAFGLWRSPAKLSQTVALRSKLLGVPYLTDCWVTSASGAHKLKSVDLNRKGKSWSVECEMLACGFHLVPNIELASTLGCRIDNGFVAVDEFQRTSCENIFCAGEPTRIGGVEASMIEGKIAGFAAVGESEEARGLFAERNRTQKFGEALNQAFALRDELKSLADDKTIVCRCEDVEYGRLKEFDSSRTAKLQTRCGMGSCQGRICGAATEFLFDWKVGSVRPPIFPVKMENL
ncbi:MAG: FAD/NAD(P)-binding oxidoreductase [Acidobacteriota bacterium]